MLELYQAYTDYEGMMDLTEALIEYLVTNLNSSKTLQFNNKEITFKRPFRRIQYVDSLNQKIGFDVLTASDKQLNTICEKFSIEYKKLTTGAKIDKLFSELVRKELVEPTFAIDYPKIISPLAKVHRSNGQLVERFQFFMFGLEIANAFSELNDPVEQRRRFEKQLALKEEGIGEIDEDFIEALDYGMPPTGGLGIGLDRLCMALFNQPSLRDVILFPQLRKE
jgi:lysyl-tRNA synthetase class 2